MAYTVDYAGDWAHVDGVEAGSYTPPGGASINTLRARRGNLSTSDVQSSILGVVPGDVVWVVWLATIGGAEALKKEAVIRVGSIDYRVITWLARADDVQARVFCRKNR